MKGLRERRRFQSPNSRGPRHDRTERVHPPEARADRAPTQGEPTRPAAGPQVLPRQQLPAVSRSDIELWFG